MSIVTTKGQATIPKNIREFLGIVPGKTDIEFIIVGDRVEVINRKQNNRFKAVRGITKDRLSTDEIMEMTRG